MSEQPASNLPAEAAGIVAAEGTDQAMSKDAAEAAADKAVAPEPAAADATAADAESGKPEAIDDIVPFVSYDEDRGHFTKEDRWIIPKRSQFPLVFCALRVRIRLETLGSPEAVRSLNSMAPKEMDSILRATLGISDLLVRADDARDVDSDASSGREVIAAVKDALPPGLQVGSVFEVEGQSLAASIVHISETCDDVDPDRITALANCFKEFSACDSIVLELPQTWIISDPDFKAKQMSIGLYPGSFWMGFMKSWGTVSTAEVFFRKTDPQQPPGHEKLVNLAVQFKDRESLKMCFTFLYDRYLVHPKQKNALRQPWCRLVSFEAFKASMLGGIMPPRAKAASTGVPTKPPPFGAVGLQGDKVPPATPSSPAKGNSVPAAGKANSSAASPAPAADKAAGGEQSDRQLTPAEAMHGLSGKQLEAFQMVMSRMERLERENQELMNILIQMQGLLQQQQQRNDQLTAMSRQGAASSSPAASTDLRNTSHLAAEAQRMAQAAPSGPTPMPPPPGQDAPWAANKRKAQVPPADTSAGPEVEDDGAEAPWKSQRRRVRRGAGEGEPVQAAAPAPQPAVVSPPVADAPQAAAPAGNGAGLAAYHNALLGV